MSIERMTFNAEEVAEVLGISVTNVYESTKRGEIPFRRFGRRLVYPRQEILDLVNTPATNGGSPWMERSNAEPGRTGLSPIPSVSKGR